MDKEKNYILGDTPDIFGVLKTIFKHSFLFFCRFGFRTNIFSHKLHVFSILYVD